MAKIIVLEGIDGAGKRTIGRMLAKAARAQFISYPSARIGLLRKYINGKVKLDKESAFFLFLADQALDLAKIKKAKKVVLNRWYFSSFAYLVDFKFAKYVDFFPKPDLIVLLDVDPKIALARKKSRNVFEKLSILKRARQRYLKMAKMDFLGKWVVIDASKPIKEVFEQVRAVCKV